MVDDEERVRQTARHLVHVHLTEAREPLAAELAEPAGRFDERLVFLAEAEPHLLRTERRIAVETRAWHAGDADFANQVTRKFHVILETKSADVRHDVIGTVGRESSKTCAFKFR